MRRSVFVINLDEADFRELLEIQRDQIGDVKIPPIGGACPFEEDVRDAIANFQSIIACESVIERDPAKGESFGRAWSLEVFIERGLGQGIGARPAVTGHDEGRGIRFVTHSVH